MSDSCGVYRGMNGKPPSLCEKREKGLQRERFHSSVLSSGSYRGMADTIFCLKQNSLNHDSSAGCQFCLKCGVDEGRVEGGFPIQYKLALK